MTGFEPANLSITNRLLYQLSYTGLIFMLKNYTNIFQLINDLCYVDEGLLASERSKMNREELINRIKTADIEPRKAQIAVMMIRRIQVPSGLLRGTEKPWKILRVVLETLREHEHPQP